MGLMQRTKGKGGEREVAALVRDLTGFNVRRKVRQSEGESDLEGVPGWCVEVKRYAVLLRSDIAKFWRQAAEQALRTGEIPVLFYRKDRDEWRAVWPIDVLMVDQDRTRWAGYEWTADTSLQSWAAVMREDWEAQHGSVEDQSAPAPVLEPALRVAEGAAA